MRISDWSSDVGSSDLPSMEIANPAQWGDQRPMVPQGYTITPVATDLEIPRQALVLPNGDILVAEGKGGGAPKLTPKDVIAGYIKAKGTSHVKGGNRLTLPIGRATWRERGFQYGE